jgi:hypothetical protein
MGCPRRDTPTMSEKQQIKFNKPTDRRVKFSYNNRAITPDSQEARYDVD